MQFTSLAIFALSAIAVSASTVSNLPNVLEQCGPDGVVTSSSTIVHNGKEIVVGTMSCPSLEKSLALSKRQTSDQCGSTCEISCDDSTESPSTPETGDCIELGVTLEQTPGTFTVESGSFNFATYGTCQAVWAPYYSPGSTFEYCYGDWGYYVINLATTCLPTYSGPACFPGSTWYIQIGDGIVY